MRNWLFRSDLTPRGPCTAAYGWNLSTSFIYGFAKKAHQLWAEARHCYPEPPEGVLEQTLLVVLALLRRLHKIHPAEYLNQEGKCGRC